MNKITNYIILFLLVGLAACNSSTSAKKESGTESSTNFASLKERNDALAKAGDWVSIQNKVNDLLNKIKMDSTDTKSKIQLAQIYMQEARITGEHPYYYPATLVILDNVLKQDPKHFEALAFKASVLLSLHHFKEALEVGNTAVAINANNGFIYGVLCDANVELGNYEAAVKMSDKMQAIRPGLESYSRASYLREIYGQNAGAIDAMEMAFQAGMPGSEEASWAGNTLSRLLENNGELTKAEEVSQVILQQRPSYAFATDALGRIEMAKGNYDKAIAYFNDAIKVMPEFSFYENMAEAYEAKGDKANAKEIYKNVLVMLNEDAQSGHYADMELAMVYLKLGDNANAMKHAKIEYDRRPLNIDVNTTMAWVLYKDNKHSEAKRYMDVALRTGKKNAELLSKASMIEKADGNQKKSNELMKQAMKINPQSKLRSS